MGSIHSRLPWTRNEKKEPEGEVQGNNRIQGMGCGVWGIDIYTYVYMSMLWGVG